MPCYMASAETFKCRVCLEYKIASAYYVYNGKRQSRCRRCSNNYSLKYNKEHSVEIAKYQKEYQDENREIITSQTKGRYESNRLAKWFHPLVKEAFKRLGTAIYKQQNRLLAASSKKETLARWRLYKPSVYYVRMGVEGPFKIGYSTNDPASRCQDHQVGNPETLTIVATQEASSPSKEKEIHALFAHLRIAGEWFTAGQELLDYIRSNCKPYTHEYNHRRKPPLGSPFVW